MARLAEPNIALSQGVVPFVGLPIDDIKETHRDLVMRNQMAHEQTGALGEYISSINDLGNDGIKKMREEELGLIEETVSTMTKNKDAHFRVREIANTAQRVKRHKGINAAKAIEVQHQAVMEHNSESKWEEQYKNAATQLSLDSIADFEYDAESNTVTGGNYSGVKLNEIPDVTSKLNSIMALFKSSKLTDISVDEFNTASEQAKAQYGIDIAPYIGVRKEEAEYYDMAQVQQAIYSAIKADPEIRQYVQTKSMLDVYMFNRSQQHLIDKGDIEGARKNKDTYISGMMDMAYDTSVIKRAEIAKYNERYPWSPFNKLSEDNQTEYLEGKVAEYRGEIMNQFKDDKGVINDEALINHLSQQAVMGNYANTYMGVFSGVKHSADLQLIRNAYFDYMADKPTDALVVPYAGGTIEVDGESYVDALKKVTESYRNAITFIDNAELENDSNYTARQAALTKLERAFPDGTRTDAQQRQIDNANDAIEQAEIAFYRKMDEMEKARDIARTEMANENYNSIQLSAIAPDFSNDIVHDFMRYDVYKKDGTNITREDIDDFLTEHMFSSDDVIQSEFAKLLNSKYVTPTDLKMLPDYYTGGITIEYTPYMSLMQGIHKYRKQYAKIIDEQGLQVPYSTISVQGVPGIETFMKDLTSKISNFELPNAKILSIGSKGKVVRGKKNQTFVGQLLGGSKLENELRGYNGGVSLDYATGSISDNGNIIVAATWKSDTRPAVSMYLEIPDTREQRKGFTDMATKAAATSTNDITRHSFNNLMSVFQVADISSTYITDNTGKPLGDNSTLGMKIGTMTKGTPTSDEGYINGNVKISVAANATGVRGMLHIDTPEGEQSIPISKQDANGRFIHPTGQPYESGADLLRDLYKYKAQLKLN